MIRRALHRVRPSAVPLSLLALFTLPALAPAQPVSQKFVQEGVAVEMTLEALGAPTLAEGTNARVRFKVTDAATGNPVAGLYPGAWMDRLPAGKTKDDVPDACRKKVQGFVGGSILSRPALDLNVYYVLALNDDASISVVDPLFGFGSSKLLAMVFLKSPGEDWALTPDEERLFVSMPDSNQVAVVETRTWKVALDLDTGPRPGRVALQPDGQYAWVAHTGGVTVIDARRLAKVADVPTGAGGHDLAFSDDSRFAFVTNESAGTVSVIDIAKLAKVRDVPTGARPVSVAWSTQARAAYVSAAEAGMVTAVSPERAEPVAQVKIDAGIGRIRFAPKGRLAFVVQTGKKQIHILDAASNRVVQTADVEAEPDQVTFSDELAYVRHRGSETVLMIPLDVVGQEGRPVPVVDFPGGQKPPGRIARPTPADGIVQAPGATAVLVANAPDKAIYYYKEGMAAPMGHFQNYGRQPRAALVVDRSLRETSPGVYETVAQLDRPGAYELALLLDAPRLVHCFPVTVAEDPVLAAKRAKRPLDVQLLTNKEVVAVQEDVAVRFRLRDPDAGTPKTGLKDVRVLTFLSPGIWQQRHWASEVEQGLYEIRFQPPEPGIYFVFLEVASAGMPFQKSPFLVLRAEGAPQAPPAQPGNGSGGPR